MEEKEPITPLGRLSLLPEYNYIIYCVLQFNNPINIDDLKHEISNSIMMKIPRFSCIFSIEPRGGSEQWKRVLVNLDDHIIIRHIDVDDNHFISDEDAINSYLANMAINSSPMNMNKPLWELHILHAQKCIVMKVHHALGDGMSLMSLLWTMGKSPKVVSKDNEHNQTTIVDYNTLKNNNSANKGDKSLVNMGLLWRSLVCIWYTLVFGLRFTVRCLWVKDKGKVISGNKGLEFWPRKVVTARFKISDMKAIKKAIPNATVHDVLCGILWCGLTRYLNIQCPQDLQDGVQITGVCPYNLRPQSGVQDVASMLAKNTRTPWGNRFSVILLPFIYMKKSLDPLSYVTLAKDMMDRKKKSMEARLSYNMMSLGSALFGTKVGGFFQYKLFCNTSFVISNIAGPKELISIGGNPISSIKVTTSGLPQAVTMHVVGYGEWANLQIQVAKDVILDPKMLAQCFEGALLEMKEAAEYSSK